jgi:hypothetical protein
MSRDRAASTTPGEQALERALTEAFEDLPRQPGFDFHTRLQQRLEQESLALRRRRAARGLRAYSLVAATLSLYILYRLPLSSWAAAGMPNASIAGLSLALLATLGGLWLLGRLIRTRRGFAEALVDLLEA